MGGINLVDDTVPQQLKDQQVVLGEASGATFYSGLIDSFIAFSEVVDDSVVEAQAQQFSKGNTKHTVPALETQKNHNVVKEASVHSVTPPAVQVRNKKQKEKSIEKEKSTKKEKRTKKEKSAKRGRGSRTTMALDRSEII